MNNKLLLTGLFCAALSGVGMCAYSQERKVVTLEEIFHCAEENSTQLKPTLTAEDEARQEIAVARSKRLPDINASLSLSYIGDGFTTKRNFTDYQKAPIPHFGSGLGVNINQPIYTGGAITKQIEIAELQSVATRFVTDFNKDNLRFRLTGYYLDLYKSHNLRSVLINNIEQAKQVLDEMTSRYAQGIVLQNDITRYELLVSNLELQLIKIENTIDIFNSNIVITAGLPADLKIEPDSTILSRSLPIQGENWWQTEASTNSPSVMLARTRVDLSRKTESLVKAQKLPKVGLQAAWTIDGPILVEVPPINRNLSYWFIGVGVSYDLSSLFKTNKSITKSKIATSRSIEELDATAENLELEIRSSYIRYLEAYEELKTQQKSVELAERNYHTTSTRYSAGMALITDMLDAANSKLDAEQQLINARINIIYNYYKLLYTSGKI